MKVPSVKVVYDRKKRAEKSGTGSVEIEVIYDRKQKFIATGISVAPNQWNRKNECVKLRNDAVHMNEVIQTLKCKVWDVLNDMVKNDRVDLPAIPSILEGKKITITFYEYLEKRARERNVSDGTKRTYRSWIGRFKAWGKIKTFSDLTPAKIRTYNEYLHKKYDNISTIHNQHKFLRLFAQDAVVDELIPFNPYMKKSFKIPKGDKENVDYLTLKQVKQIEGLNFKGYMEHTKDLFLLQCYSGLSYSDIYNVSKEGCVMTEYGYVYTNRRVKTKQRFTFLIMSDALRILDKYNWELPRINNAKYNEWLKVIGQCINEPKLHSHQGRGAFATIALNKGMSMEVVRKILGHRNIKQTEKYATMLDTTIAEQMSAILG